MVCSKHGSTLFLNCSLFQRFQKQKKDGDKHSAEEYSFLDGLLRYNFNEKNKETSSSAVYRKSSKLKATLKDEVLCLGVEVNSFCLKDNKEKKNQKKENKKEKKEEKQEEQEKKETEQEKKETEKEEKEREKEEEEKEKEKEKKEREEEKETETEEKETEEEEKETEEEEKETEEEEKETEEEEKETDEEEEKKTEEETEEITEIDKLLIKNRKKSIVVAFLNNSDDEKIEKEKDVKSKNKQKDNADSTNAKKEMEDIAVEVHIFEKKRIRWGSFRIINFEKVSLIDPEIEEQLILLEEKYKSNEVGIVYELILKDYYLGHTVSNVLPSGICNMRWLSFKNDKICLQKSFNSDVVENEVHIKNVKSIVLGFNSENFKKYSNNLTKADENKCLVLNLHNEECLSFLFLNFYQRNSFALLIRIKVRILKKENLDRMTIQQAFEIIDEETSPFFQNDNNLEEENLLENMENENNSSSLSFFECLSFKKFLKGVDAYKITSKGQSARRCVMLMGDDIRIYCRIKNRGQVLGIHDDILKITCGLRSPEFALFHKLQNCLLPSNQCITIHMADHRCCIFFDSQDDRKSFIFLINYIKKRC